MPKVSPPVCPNCPNVMRLIVMAPDERGGEHRTYECVVCGHEETIYSQTEPSRPA